MNNSGTPDYEGHQALNVPKLRASLYADYALPWMNGLAVLGGVQYSAKKYADRTGNVQVGDYAVVNVGSRYTTKIDGYGPCSASASITCSTNATGAMRVNTWATTTCSRARP